MAAVAALSGCAQAQYVPTADGRGSFDVQCPANNLRWCYAKADSTCPRGYRVLETHLPDNRLLPGIWEDHLIIQCNGGTRP
jgi:hypothetical protein